MAKVVADALSGELDVVLVRKLRAPGNPELAIGSIDETGAIYLDSSARDLWDESYLEAETAAQLAILRHRRQQYASFGAPFDAKDRIVIVVDDGIATGSTMIAALRAIRARHPAALVVAVGVIALETLGVIRHEADEAVSLETPVTMRAVGEYFRDFTQVSDADVVTALRDARQPRTTDLDARR